MTAPKPLTTAERGIAGLLSFALIVGGVALFEWRLGLIAAGLLLGRMLRASPPAKPS